MKKKTQKITKVKPLTKSDIDARKAAAKALEKIDKVIHKRITYILSMIHKAYGRKLKYWYFLDAQEGTVGDCGPGLNEEGIWVEMNPPYEHNDIVIIDNEEFFFIDYGFPAEWLTEDFEQELFDGIKAYEARDEAREDALLLEKENEKELFKAAKKKLTKAELEALTGKKAAK